jgi:DNA topoisomerase IB
MPRLRRSDPSRPGYTRRRRGRGFIYLDPWGQRVTDPAVLQRITDLVLPPAWNDVWICPYPNGHIQAIGTDAAGRRQYRYHDEWRLQRDRAKHDKILTFAEALPAARKVILEQLNEPGLTKRRVLACAVRLLDLGFFRIGSEEYAEEHETYGLATMRREHVTISGSVISFAYTAKGGLHREQSVADQGVLAVVKSLKRRRGGGEELLAYRDGGGWRDVRSADINVYLRETLGGEFTAKDFRTWNATVLAAVGLASAVPAASSPTAAKRAVAHVVKDVSRYLGNTPAVCRKSYIDPRVVELYQDGVTIVDDLDSLGACAEPGGLATQGPIEEAVLRLLRGEKGRTGRNAAPLRRAG